MPEGPETHRTAARLERVLAGRAALDVSFEIERLRRFERTLRGRNIEHVSARGKALLVGFAGGYTLYSHNQLYGRWVVWRRPGRPDSSRSLRVAIRTSAGAALLYSASDVAVLRERGLARHPYLKKLGPDALAAATTRQAVLERLGDSHFARRSLAALLLDQSFVSGLGNYLRSEILFVSALAHDRSAGSLEPAERARLAETILRLPRRSLAGSGVTVPRARFRQAQASGVDRERARFFVFGRDGDPCPRCSAPIVRDEAAGRRIYFCGECQGPPRGARRRSRA